jgi:bacterioferritin
MLDTFSLAARAVTPRAQFSHRLGKSDIGSSGESDANARRGALADRCAYVQRHGSYQRSSCAESLPKAGFQGMIHVIPTAREGELAMERTFDFDVDRVVEHLDRILQMELAGVIYYTHYSFMIYGHARIPITSWLRDNATESLAHAQEAGQMIMRLHKRPKLGIAELPLTQHNTIDAILTESIEREQNGVQLYRDLLGLIKDKSVVLEEYVTRVIAAEAIHIREMELMLMKQAPE